MSSVILSKTKLNATNMLFSKKSVTSEVTRPSSLSGIWISPSGDSSGTDTREEATTILTILFPFNDLYSLLDLDVNRAHISALAIPSSKNFFTTSSKFAFEEYSRRIFEPSIFGWSRLRRVENGSDASERLTSSTSAFFCKKSATWGLGALLDSSRSTSASGSLGFLDSLAIDPIELWRSCRSSSFTNTVAVWLRPNLSERPSFPNLLSSERAEKVTNFPFSVHSLKRESLRDSPSTSQAAEDLRTTFAPASIVLRKAEDRNDIDRMLVSCRTRYRFPNFIRL